MHFLYILYSEKLNRYYIGESSNPEKRLNQHNEHYYKRSFTKAAEDWELKLKFGTHSKEDALYLEKFIKRMKSKEFIEKIILNPAILHNILENI